MCRSPGIGSDIPADGRLVPIPELNPDFAWTAGAATATVSDLALFAREMTDGTLLSPELLPERLATARFTGIDRNVGYGLGVLNMNDLIGPNDDLRPGESVHR